ncbi:hypothetical protein [Citrobacter farmeri]
MASEFSVGVIIGGIVGSSFRSAVSGTRRALDSLGDTSRRLQERQDALNPSHWLAMASWVPLRC